MITRACISVNNRCNLRCVYCHFHTSEKIAALKERDMNIDKIFDNIVRHIETYNVDVFKLGFVGNGEPLLEFEKLKAHIESIGAYLQKGRIAAYTITNGVLLTRPIAEFFKRYNVNVGLSIDGIADIHNLLRCNSHSLAMRAAELYREVNGVYPSMNCTVGREVLARADETVEFFSRFNNRVTFSRMIGEGGISLGEYRNFMRKAASSLRVRTGEYDCTMYGGLCGAGINNIFYANGRIYLCGNCVDLPSSYSSDTPLDEIEFGLPDFDRNFCYKETYCRRI